MSHYHDVITIVTDDGLVDAIRDLTRENGYPPTIAELGERVQLRARSTVHRRLARLRRERRITGGDRASGGTRTLSVVDPGDNPYLSDEQRTALEQAIADVQAAIPDPPHPGEHRSATYVVAYERGWRDGFRAGVRS